MLDAMRISATGLMAQDLRLGLVADNLANANTPGFRRLEAFLRPLPPGPDGVGQGVVVAAVAPDPAPVTQTYAPQSPLANAQGWVAGSNVSLGQALSNLLQAQAAYGADAAAFNAGKALDGKALTL